jgi:hypothetical protein
MNLESFHDEIDTDFRVREAEKLKRLWQIECVDVTNPNDRPYDLKHWCAFLLPVG